jgi:hypothetical protein
MKLYILGKGKDDKGKQLEEITASILTELNYTYVCTNSIGAGGHEIDVKARSTHNVLGKETAIPIICECKAHDKPINTNDWLKFLGKVHTERTARPQTIGVLIALTGVNGNVSGAYEDMEDKGYVFLIAQDSLTNIICKHFKLRSVDEIRSFVSHETIRAIDTIDLVYYRKEIWWIVGFTTGEFTFFANEFYNMESERLDKFLDLLSLTTPYRKSKFVSPQDEEIYQIRRDIMIKGVIYLLMINRRMSHDDLLQSLKELCHQPDIDKNEMLSVIKKCLYLKTDEDSVQLKTDEEIDFAEFYRWYNHGQLILESIVLPFYSNHIDKVLFEEILRIQMHIEIPEDKIDDCMFILKMSPSALVYALTPDDVIVNARRQGADKIAPVNEFHTTYFMNSLAEHLLRDLQNPRFSSFYCCNFGLNDYSIETELQLKFVNSAKNRKITYSSYVSFLNVNGNVVPMLRFEKPDSSK